MHFRDLIDNGNFSAKQEIDCIIGLLDKNDEFNYSIRRLLNTNFNRFSKMGPFISFDDLLKHVSEQTSNEDELLILICEMLLLLINEYIHTIAVNNSDVYIFSYSDETEVDLKHLEIHIFEVVDRIHHKIIYTDDDYSFIIIPKEKKSIQAAEIVACTDEDIALKILEYKHFSTTVDDKENILISIAKYMEDKRVELTESLKEDNLYIQRNNKIVLVDQMFEMFNTLHIRHNNRKQYIKESQREQWYDNTYNTILTVIIIDEHAKINKEFKRLKEENRKK